MNSGKSYPLFHRAILESGAATARAVYPYDKKLHILQLQEFLVEAGCSNIHNHHIMRCLQSRSGTTLAKASDEIFQRYYDTDRWAFQPVIDGDIIKQAPIKAWKSGHRNRVPILTGFNTNEGNPFVPPMMSRSDEFIQFFNDLIPSMPKRDLRLLGHLYPDPIKHPSSPYKETRNITIGPQFRRAEAAYAHFAYICPVRQTARLASAGQEEPVYLYHWALNRTVKGGASHGDQIKYETLDGEVRATSMVQKYISEIFHAYLTSFITTGNPNSAKGNHPDRPVWSKFKSQDGSSKLMLFGNGNDEQAGGNGIGTPAQLVDDITFQKECNFWSEKSILTES